MKQKASEHIINALAAYICVTSIQKNRFIRDVELKEMGGIFGANAKEQDKAMKKAQEMIRDFL